MFSKKVHDIMRKLQLIFAAAGGALGILAAAVDLGTVGVICSAVLSSAAYFVGQLAEEDSGRWTASVTITPKDEEVHG